MKLAIETLGTRGDVQPYVALALGLQRAGHDVQIAAPAQFERVVVDRGIVFAALPGDFLALLDSPEGKAAVAGGEGFSAGFKLLKHVRPMLRRLLEESWAASRRFGPDAIIYHPKAISAPHVAEKLGVPAILASPLPGFTPTSAFPSPLLNVASLGPVNRASHALAIHGSQLLFGKMIREWRGSTLGLPEARAKAAPPPTLYAYSPHVLPVPPDWDARHVLVSGYWFLDEAPTWSMPDDLRTFVQSGDRPIYIGFGSMPGLDPQALARAVVEALALAGRRGLLATGGGAIAPEGSTASHVRFIHSAPHDELFKHVDAVLHHGGAGTTGAGLRAGLPTIICPFFGDQPFWGRRVADLGVGPGPLDRKRLTPGILAEAFKATESTGIRGRAAALGEAIRGEAGVANAIRFVEGRVASV